MLRFVARASMWMSFLCAVSAAQKNDPMQDPEIWGPEAPPYHRALDSIFPDEWLIVPSGESGAREILSRWILDPTLSVPKGCDESKVVDARGGKWLRRTCIDAGKASCAFTT